MNCPLAVLTLVFMKGLPPDAFGREDEAPDELFYRAPRLVTHIDAGAIADGVPARASLVALPAAQRLDRAAALLRVEPLLARAFSRLRGLACLGTLRCELH